MEASSDGTTTSKWLRGRWLSYFSGSSRTRRRQKNRLTKQYSLQEYQDELPGAQALKAKGQTSGDSGGMSVATERNAAATEGDIGQRKVNHWGALSGMVESDQSEDRMAAPATINYHINKAKDKYERLEDAKHHLEEMKGRPPMLLMAASSTARQCESSVEQPYLTMVGLPSDIDNFGEEFFLTFLVGGSYLTKVVDKNKTYRRFYRFDRHRKMIYYDGSKKKAKQSARYDSRDMIDVRQGYQTDVFNKCEGKYKEDCCFSIIFSGRAQPVNLVADFPEICELWIRGLKFLVHHNERLQKQQDEKMWITDYFYAADSSHDGHLEFEEVWNLLQRMSVKMSKKEAKQKFHKADKDKVRDAKGNPTLSLEEFVHFYHDLCRREELYSLFRQFSSHPNRLYMSSDDLYNFMAHEQGHALSMDKIHNMIEKYEPNVEERGQRLLSTSGFIFILNSHMMNIRNFEHSEVYQDMTRPLNHYFISSSHNTYLMEDQLRGPSSIEGYIKALMSGCRCVELDCWDGDNDTGPMVYHGHTLTGKILFKDIIEDAIRHYAFYRSPYPLILSLENHCCIEQQKMMAKILVNSLGDMLLKDPIDYYIKELPSPENLKGKILIKCRKLPAGVAEASAVEAEDDSEDEVSMSTGDGASMKEISNKKRSKGKIQLAKELSDLVTYVQSVSFHGFDVVKKQGKVYEMSSYSEKKAQKLIDEEPDEFVRHSNIQLCRIYPAGFRTDSSNYSPVDMWNVGCQLVSLNFQTPDRHMQIYRGRFKDNGACGYLLKPAFMTDRNTTFNPKGPFSDNSGKAVKIQVISGSHLPKPEGGQNSSDLVDPYVKIEIYGVREDVSEFRTSTVPDNGLNPQWNETFEFHLSVPDLAIIRFTVKDHDMLTTNDIIGQCSIPFSSLKRGYRHVKLESSEGVPLGPASIFVYTHVQDEISKLAWQQRTGLRSGKTVVNKSGAVKHMLGNTGIVNMQGSLSQSTSLNTSRDSTENDSLANSNLNRQSSSRSRDSNTHPTFSF